MISSRYHGSIRLHVFIKLVVGYGIFWSVVWILHLAVYGADLDPEKYVLVSLLVPGAAFLELAAREERFRSLSGLSRSQIRALTQREILFALVSIFGLIVMSKDPDLSRAFLAIFIVLYSLWIAWMNQVGYRMLQRRLYRSLQQGQANALVVAPANRICRESAHMMTSNLPGAEFLGCVPYGSSVAPGGAMSMDSVFPVLGDFGNIRDICREYRVRLLVTLGLEERGDLIRSLQELCDSMGMRLIWSDDKRDRFGAKLDSHRSGTHLFLTNWEEPLEDPVNRVMKRVLDVAFSALVSVFVIPLLCVWVWSLHRLFSPGPLFYRQERTGRNGEIFPILKFRTMHLNDSPGLQARNGDPRIFPGAGFLRRSSLDEMPQFLNVLRGDMSVVGPRPHFVDHDEEFAKAIDDYSIRHFAKPGITGLAQVKGLRGEVDSPRKIRQRVKMDHFYLHHWSLLLDLCLIAETVRQVIFPPKSAQ